MTFMCWQVGDRDARLEGYSSQLALLRGQTEAYEAQLRDVRKEVRELAQVRRGQALRGAFPVSPCMDEADERD